MATLGEPVRLLSKENRLETLYIEGDKSPKCAVITTGGRHINVYDVRDSQPQNSWTIMSGHQLTHGAVLDTVSNRYVAVVDHQVIRLWNKEDASINKSKKITLSQQVSRLLSVGQFQPLIVYADGSMAWLSSPTEWLTAPWVPGGDQLMWAEGTVVQETLVVVAITKPKENTPQKAMVFVLKDDAISVQGRQLEITEPMTSPSCLCLRLNGAEASMMSINVSGVLTETWLTGASFGHASTLHPVPTHGAVSALCSLGPGRVAVYGAQSPSDTACLGIWDTKFGILQAWKPLPVSSTEKEQVRLYRQGGHLLVACSKGVFVYPFACRSSTLGAALGRFSSTCTGMTDEPALSGVTEILKRLSSSEKTKTHKQFSQAFNCLIQELDKDKTFDALTVQHQAAAVIKRVISETEFWPREEVHQLIKRSLVPGSVITELMEALTTRGELPLLLSCVTCLRDIPEPAIVHTLGFVLRTEESKFEEKKQASTKKKPEVCPFGPQKAAFVCSLLGLPFNDVFLAGKLKNIDFQSCLQLLQYLHFLLERRSSSTKRPLFLVKVVDWVSLLLDAHFAQMVLSPEARSVLVDLHQTVDEQVNFCNELVGLESILAQIKEKCALPEKQYPGLYNIHVLHVN